MTTSTFDGGGVWFLTVDEALAAGKTALTSKGSHLCNWGPPGPHGPRIVYHRTRGVAVWNAARGLWSRYTCACRVSVDLLGRLGVFDQSEANRFCFNTHTPYL